MTRNGFTLIELMVVILLMALVAGAVTMSVRASGAGPSADAARLAARLAAARDSAITGTRAISFWATPSGYGFDVHRGGEWRTIAAKPFEATDWANGTRIEAGGAPGADRARVSFDSLGMPDRPFVLRIERDGERARVEVAANGDVSVG